MTPQNKMWTKQKIIIFCVFRNDILWAANNSKCYFHCFCHPRIISVIFLDANKTLIHSLNKHF